MTFHESCREYSLEKRGNKTILHASAQDQKGIWKKTEIDLDNHLGNINGEFVWGKKAFTATAEDVELRIVGEAKVPVLRATLQNGKKGWEEGSKINLSERIDNKNGTLVFV